MYGLSNSENIFDLRWPLKVKGHGQTSKKNLGTLLFQSTIDIHIQNPHKKWVVPCWLHWLLQYALCCYQTAKAHTLCVYWSVKELKIVILSLANNNNGWQLLLLIIYFFMSNVDLQFSMALKFMTACHGHNIKYETVVRLGINFLT